jgi:antitoxin (DNA-binding transcriptional repressor) of toxin-antitoxin stability system
MRSVTVGEAQAVLPELIERLAGGEEFVITRDRRPVAQLVPPVGDKPQPVFGGCKGKLVIVAEDEEHLSDFQEPRSGTSTPTREPCLSRTSRTG